MKYRNQYLELLQKVVDHIEGLQKITQEQIDEMKQEIEDNKIAYEEYDEDMAYQADMEQLITDNL